MSLEAPLPPYYVVNEKSANGKVNLKSFDSLSPADVESTSRKFDSKIEDKVTDIENLKNVFTNHIKHRYCDTGWLTVFFIYIRTATSITNK